MELSILSRFIDGREGRLGSRHCIQYERGPSELYQICGKLQFKKKKKKMELSHYSGKMHIMM